MTEEFTAEFEPVLHAAGLDNPGELLDESPLESRMKGDVERLGKSGIGARERLRWRPNLARAPGMTFYIKRYFHTGLREQLDRMFRQVMLHSRAWWEFRQSRTLTGKFIPVVQAVGIVERMRGPYEQCSAAVFNSVPGDAFDRAWTRLQRDDAPISRPPRRHDVARGLARFVAAFHQTGYCHRDLYLCHIFADFDEAGARPPQFTLIDLARTHYPRLRRMRWLVKDLSQLDYSARQIGATRSDRLRFLIAYLGLLPHAPRVRYFARRVTAKSDAIQRRERRKNPSG